MHIFSSIIEFKDFKFRRQYQCYGCPCISNLRMGIHPIKKVLLDTAILTQFKIFIIIKSIADTIFFRNHGSP